VTPDKISNAEVPVIFVYQKVHENPLLMMSSSTF